MAKYPAIALFLLLFGGVSLCAQAKKPVPMRCDTIKAGAWVCAGADVVSCRVTVISNMIIMTHEYKMSNGCVEGSSNFKAQTLVYFEDIVTSPRPGVLVKQPPLRVYVQ